MNGTEDMDMDMDTSGKKLKKIMINQPYDTNSWSDW